jgi:hypothetical protein
MMWKYTLMVTGNSTVGSPGLPARSAHSLTLGLRIRRRGCRIEARADERALTFQTRTVKWNCLP